MQLNDNQIMYLQNWLTESGLTDQDLHNEMLDHLCCETELNMSNGNPFHQAAQLAISAFPKSELLALNDHYLNSEKKKKDRNIIAYSLLALLILIASFGLWMNRSGIPEGSPVGSEYNITSDFGPRYHPVAKKMHMHKGIDYKVPVGTEVKATANGTVLSVSYKPGYGRTVVIEHADQIKTLYAHLDAWKVNVGDKVNKNDVIALSGNSGVSTLPHLHYEVIKDGHSIDPVFYKP